MIKYRCVRADNATNVMHDLDRTRTYIEDGIQNARKRAMKMIHGDKGDSVLIWLDSDFKNYPWIGYHEKVVVDMDDKHTYYTIKIKGTFSLTPNGSVKERVW